ncbi:MAG: nuclear transport factor 2 family protein [Pseudomonadota bacterium]|jgi:ketosteroid isomerase-like protein
MSAAPSIADRLLYAYEQWHETRGQSAELFLDLLADDVRLRSVLNPPELHPLADARVGIDRARDYLTSLTVTMEMIDSPTHQLIVDGDTIVWVGSCRWRDRRTGREIATPKVDIWHFQGGKCVSLMEMYDTLGFARLSGLVGSVMDPPQIQPGA